MKLTALAVLVGYHSIVLMLKRRVRTADSRSLYRIIFILNIFYYSYHEESRGTSIRDNRT